MRNPQRYQQGCRIIPIAYAENHIRNHVKGQNKIPQGAVNRRLHLLRNFRLLGNIEKLQRLIQQGRTDAFGLVYLAP